VLSNITVKAKASSNTGELVFFLTLVLCVSVLSFVYRTVTSANGSQFPFVMANSHASFKRTPSLPRFSPNSISI